MGARRDRVPSGAAGAVVREDIQMVAGTARVDGHLTGSVSLTAGQIEVGPAGRIDGSVALAMGQVTVRPGGSIGGSIVVSGQTPRTGLTCPRGGADCALVGGSHQSGQTAPWRAFAHRYRGGPHLFRRLLLTRFGTGTTWFRRGGTAPPAA